MIDDEPADDFDPAIEWKLRAWAIPAALALALAFNCWPTGHMLQRTFLTMIPHEVGHALTGWWCGITAVPGLWKTLIPETRGVLAPIVVAGLAIGLAYVGWRTERTRFVIAALVLGGLQLVGSTCRLETAHTAITFGGDGGAMVIGTLLVMTFFAPADSKLRAGGLRWGLLVIGAAAYVDTAMTWCRARGDHELIPFGEIEGVGLSDPSKLAEAGWNPTQIVARYMLLATACLAAIVGVWAWQTWAMRRRATSSR